MCLSHIDPSLMHLDIDRRQPSYMQACNTTGSELPTGSFTSSIIRVISSRNASPAHHTTLLGVLTHALAFTLAPRIRKGVQIITSHGDCFIRLASRFVGLGLQVWTGFGPSFRSKLGNTQNGYGECFTSGFGVLVVSDTVPK